MRLCSSGKRAFWIGCGALFVATALSAPLSAQTSPAPADTLKPAPASPAPADTPKPAPASPEPAETPKPAPASPAPADTPKPPQAAHVPETARPASTTSTAGSPGPAATPPPPVAQKPVSQEYCLNSKFVYTTDELARHVQFDEAHKKQQLIKINIAQLQRPDRADNGSVVVDSLLLPSGSNVDIGITNTFAASDLHYAYLKFSDDKVFELKSIRSRAATGDDPLVKKNKLASGNTIINLSLPDIDWSLSWKRARLYVFGCEDNNPRRVLQTDVRVSPARYSAIAGWLCVVLIYLLAAFALRTEATSKPLALLNPVQFTAGMDGKASMGKLQVLFFSLIVFGLLIYLLLRTGVLSDISGTVLSLLGIAGFGSTIAKGADRQRTTLSPENRAFLIRKRWLDPNRPASANVATWRELFMTSGEFDVYRYQSFIFSLAVGVALVIGGVTQLSSFEIPQTLLGILGLSQAVYIGGKLVTPTTMADLNKSLDDLRNAEAKFQDGAKAANDGIAPQALTAPIQAATQPTYDAYKRLATDVRTLFTAETGIEVSPDKLEPSI